MAVLNPRRFAQLDSLKAINPTHLHAFLEPYKDYFQSRGMNLREEIHYAHLNAILMTPTDDMDHAMVDALHYVHEMATEEGMDALIMAAEAAGIKLEHDAQISPADVVVQMWLKSPAILLKTHAEMMTAKPKSFQYYMSQRTPAGQYPDFSPSAVAALEKELDSWFDSKKRGKGTNVAVIDHGQEVFFIIKHGSPFKREGSLKEGKSETVFYRPEIHDVLKYNRDRNELGVRDDNKGQINLYLEKIGRHFFGDENYFDKPDKYTLQPLKTDMAASLVCSDIDGISSIRLTELQLSYGKGETDTRKTKKCLATSTVRNFIPPQADIVVASFAVHFQGSKTARSVKIRTPNIAVYTRDEDSSLIEEWLQKRGFIVQPKGTDDKNVEASVACA